ncbi:Gfo/Idh/MocA family protein [Roseinatronobacter bogoriensis]|uniref:Gfo/Idh/MocA family oxidoreductase n=1 Tax=Roseinatronobacter bogoriensis subsp. barguzinensis TaxID=441209 RepID=A0A2K8KAZ1_9RHOB|nr:MULTISPECIES: Gfo/Idh/MocA family oxidoreductase [Rhodobaca]ATX66611.1 gfo/Idh/MocA family oxidoreductase [Rhodobaca barguzinensis]MBB4207786.1 putative dehydrogenase [Rhodobaca bogoriensis DSM 18756]TDW39907.1 putative dehydrogenase [Rhodobaca barguzinensis]TDY70940.1 putative dehydrogenase [Rhodobaca bogoriensis DSM 18756]
MRWGILGAAKIARTDLAPAIQLARGAELVAVATRDPARAAPFQALVPGLRVHDSYQALLDDPTVDAVYIPLPNHLHVEWSVRAAEAGKHVLCEKPIALEAGQVDTLIATREKTGKLIAEAFMVAHHPQWERVRTLLADGVIGKLEHVEGSFTYTNRDLSNIRHSAEMGGGGLRDVGVYPCITTRMVTGAEPERLLADIRFQNGVDIFARVWADFPGFTMSFYCGMMQARRQQMVFHGQDGWITMSAPFNGPVYGDTCVEWKAGDTVQVERFNNVNQYALMIEAFVDSARNGSPFACPLEMSRGNQAMIDAIFENAR